MRGGITPLIGAASQRHSAVVAALLAHGADVTAADSHGNTALICSVQSADIPTISTLLGHGADPNARNHEGRTPLHIATHAPEVQLLLNAGADVHARDNSGQTPLHRQAVEWHKSECTPLLLGAGADLEARDASGETALHKVAGMKEPCQGLWQPLLDAGADPNATNEAGEPVHRGASSGEAVG